MSNSPRKRPVKKSSKVTALPVTEPVQQTYVTLDAQGQVNALLKRLGALENDHFQYGCLIEEEMALGNEQAVPQLQQEMVAVEKRIEFVRNKMESLGVVFGAMPEATETDEAEGDGAE